MYFIFFNPETKAFVDEVLNNELVQGKEPSKSIPGVNVPVMDYQNQKSEEVFIICIMKENMMLPTFAFLNKDNAVEHIGKPNETQWTASYTLNKSESLVYPNQTKPSFIQR